MTRHLRSKALTLTLFVALACQDANAPGGAATLAIVSGDVQSGIVGKALAQPIVVKVTDLKGNPIKGEAITFTVTGGGGSMASGSGATDDGGTSSDVWTLGTHTSDSQRVHVTASDPITHAVLDSVTFSASTVPDVAASVAVSAGDQQVAVQSQPLDDSLHAIVKDQYGNVVPGVTVSWAVTAGGGSISPATSTTGATGIAAALATAGSGAVSATATVGTLTAAAFSATITQAIAMVTMGEHHTCALTTAGVPYCWGRSYTTQPAVVPGGLTFTTISAGWREATCAMTAAGAAYCWGKNDYGQLGDGTTTDRAAPTAVTGGLTFTTVGQGGMKGCGLLGDGSVSCWSATNFGNRDLSPITYSTAPVAVGGGVTFAKLSVGGVGYSNQSPQSHVAWSVCGVTAANAAFCWGSISANALTPTAVPGAPALTSVSTGLGHACGLTAAGAAYCWGQNGFGQLGDATKTSNNTPVGVSGGLTFKAIAAGSFFTCGLTTDGTPYCWGRNDEGELGNDTTTAFNFANSSPVPVKTKIKFASIAAGGSEDAENQISGTTVPGQACAITAKGVLYCWGGDFYGQITGGDPASVLVPRAVRIP